MIDGFAVSAFANGRPVKRRGRQMCALNVRVTAEQLAWLRRFGERETDGNTSAAVRLLVNRVRLAEMELNCSPEWRAQLALYFDDAGLPA